MCYRIAGDCGDGGYCAPIVMFDDNKCGFIVFEISHIFAAAIAVVDLLLSLLPMGFRVN